MGADCKSVAKATQVRILHLPLQVSGLTVEPQPLPRTRVVTDSHSSRLTLRSTGQSSRLGAVDTDGVEAPSPMVPGRAEVRKQGDRRSRRGRRVSPGTGVCDGVDDDRSVDDHLVRSNCAPRSACASSMASSTARRSLLVDCPLLGQSGGGLVQRFAPTQVSGLRMHRREEICLQRHPPRRGCGPDLVEVIGWDIADQHVGHPRMLSKLLACLQARSRSEAANREGW